MLSIVTGCICEGVLSRLQVWRFVCYDASGVHMYDV